MTDVQDAAARIAERLSGRGRLTVLTGAGISAESGIPTFRDLGGYWRSHDIMQVATPEGFARNPTLVHTFYNERRAKLDSVVPNPGHHALSELERALGDRFTLITQNVDDLHERAQSKRVWHMHGELKKARCVRCETPFEWVSELGTAHTCDRCGGQMRPHIVWFGEIPFFMDDVIPKALVCDVFASIGTSGAVYPANQFATAARTTGALSVEINLEPTAGDFDIQLIGKAAEILPRLIGAVTAVLSLA